jgi:hypothetical protein
VNQTIKMPATVVELGDMAEAMGMTVVELLQMLPPIPRKPAGYTLAADLTAVEAEKG